MIHPRLACTLVLLLIFLGTITTKTQAQSLSGVVIEDAVNKLLDPLDGPSRPAPKLKVDGEFQSAPTLFRQGKFAEAERQFAWIAEVRKGTTWGERSQYYLAECHYQQKKYIEALESLERLYRDYPATDYCDQLIRREYEIAQHCITWTKPAVLTAKQPALARDALEGPRPASTEKLALRALEDVRQHAPSSPLAAEASIKVAEYYMAKGDYAFTATPCYDKFSLPQNTGKSPLCPRARMGAIESRVRVFLFTHRDSAGMTLARELAKLFLILDAAPGSCSFVDLSMACRTADLLNFPTFPDLHSAREDHRMRNWGFIGARQNGIRPDPCKHAPRRDLSGRCHLRKRSLARGPAAPWLARQALPYSNPTSRWSSTAMCWSWR